MNKLLGVFSIIIANAVFIGCEIITEEPSPVQLRPAPNVVINEVFTLPTTNQAPYSWIEFINPTRDSVDIGNWTLSLNTVTKNRIIVVRLDSLFGNASIVGFEDEAFYGNPGRYEVRLGDLSPQGSTLPIILLPGELFTIVSDEARMRDHTDWGPASTENRRVLQDFPIVSAVLVDSSLRSHDTVIVTVIATLHRFLLQETEQLILKNGQGQVMDVVRYGNYVAPAPDPYPNNLSQGTIPPYESLARYAGAYKTDTGNTAADFYVTDPNVRPIPHWYSQRYKR